MKESYETLQITNFTFCPAPLFSRVLVAKQKLKTL